MINAWRWAMAGAMAASAAFAADNVSERQLTFTPKNHNLDNNDNFSPDGRFLVYDTREMVGPGINSSLSVEKVEIATGKETVLYAPQPYVIGMDAAPGVGAASYSPVADEVVFIHGPFLQEVPFRGWYAKPNRQGAVVPGDGSAKLTWMDVRDIAKDRDTIPGAHRGGTHRHEYSLDGKRVGFTYDDFLMPEYGRTIGFMVEHPKAPAPASHYFALLVPIAATGKAKPGEIEVASADSWIGREGLMRAFIGKVREEDGSYAESLFVIDVPADVDVTTADAGSATRYPKPPAGVKIRRLTHTPASGTVRGTVEGDRIAYFAPAPDGTKQVFIIPSDGSDRDPDPAKRPVQATSLPKGADGGLRWHPSGKSVLCISNGGIAVTCVKPGPNFGRSRFLTAQGDGQARNELVLSPDGRLAAYTRVVPTKDETGTFIKNYLGQDPVQIFTVDFPDADGDGVAD